MKSLHGIHAAKRSAAWPLRRSRLSMRPPVLLLVPLLLLSGCLSRPTGGTAEDVGLRYVPEEDFARISEFFTGRENPGDRLYLRSQPEKRAGFYWIIDADPTLRREGEEVRLEVQIPGSPETRSFAFPLAAEAAGSLWIGLTGPDWPGPDARPIAWHLAVVGENGSILREHQSFLWTDEAVNGSHAKPARAETPPP